MRNLTYDGMLERAKQQKAEAVAAVPEYETVIASTPKKDPKTGRIVLDEDGIPVIVEKRLLKRAIVAAEWDDKLKPYEALCHDNY